MEDLSAWRAAALPAFYYTSFFVAACAIPVGRHALDRGFQVLGRRWLPRKGVSAAAAALTFTKWREACWRMTTYGVLTALGVATCVGEPWIRDPALLWAGWPLRQTHSSLIQFWYAVEFGLYLYSVADLLLWEASRGDYYAMLLHHASTLLLLFGSFSYAFLRVGAIILMINDFVDLWFEGAKLAKYAARENMSTAFFLAFVASWAWLRQVYCPFFMIRSMLLDAWGLVAQFGPTPRHVAIYATFNALVIVLQILHSYWFFFLLQKIKLTVSISVSIKVVDRRPGVEVEPRAAAIQPIVTPALQMNTAATLLEEE